MKQERIKESELVLPSLYIMSLQNGKIDTSKLIELLTDLIKPSGIDAKIITGRQDTFFSQKVRNLKSHDTFTKNGYATYDNTTGYTITNNGINFVEQNMDSIKYLFGNDFEYNDIKTTLNKIGNIQVPNKLILPYNELVTEGGTILTTSTTTQRSKGLRIKAIEHFTKNGLISCDCCGFEFKSFYGDKYGKSCIEIHHMKPIFQYDGIPLTQTIDDALKNLLPVCPNCHRVIHKNNITASMIPSFKEAISQNHL